jgi:hypothetical protein
MLKIKLFIMALFVANLHAAEREVEIINESAGKIQLFIPKIQKKPIEINGVTQGIIRSSYPINCSNLFEVVFTDDYAKTSAIQTKQKLYLLHVIRNKIDDGTFTINVYDYPRDKMTEILPVFKLAKVHTLDSSQKLLAITINKDGVLKKKLIRS